MSCYLRNLSCYIIVLTVFVDQGDGHWKRRGREKLERDIIIFRKIADDIEREIEDFYDDYSDEKSIDEDDLFETKHGYSDVNNVTIEPPANELKYEHSLMPPLNVTSDTRLKESSGNYSRAIKNDTNDLLSVPLVIHTKESVRLSNWPKFNDILLAIGKRYDWKNDRWIKVKEKAIETNEISSRNSEKSSLSKHKFSYRIVKLNRSKSRRNVVMAVKAVR